MSTEDMASSATKKKPRAAEKKSRANKDAEKKSAGLITQLKKDHRALIKLLDGFDSKATADAKSRAIAQLAMQWIRHNDFEEKELLSPIMAAGSVSVDLELAEIERDLIKLLLMDLRSVDPGRDRLDGRLKVLTWLVKKLVHEEERPKTGLFAVASSIGLDMTALNERLSKNMQVLSDAEGETVTVPYPSLPVSLRIPGIRRATRPEEGMQMQRQSNDRERDEQGRFVSDDDDDRRSGGRGSSRSRDDDYDDRRGSSQSRSRGSESRGSTRRSDDDEGRGWFGDSEGHSEAARRGWEDRQGGSSRSRGRDDDDDRRSGRSSRYEDDRRSSRSSRDDDDDGRRSRGSGHGGWFGDSEGHSEASRRGWEERQGSSRSRMDDDDDRRSYRSGRYEDDDRRGGGSRSDDRDEDRMSSRRRDDDYADRRSSSRSRQADDDDRGSRGGRSGWSGDPEGHSEAARRGWANRR